MKAIITLFLILSFFSVTFSQKWLENLPQNKSKSEFTFFDYQKAFYSFWEPYNVVNGYYIENGIRKKAYGWKQFKRWEYQMESVVDPLTGAFPEKSAFEIIQEAKQNKSSEKSFSTSDWTSLGASNSSGGYSGIGRINSVAFHPTDLSTYWVGSAGGGLWKTTDNGATWTAVTDNIGSLKINDVVLAPDFTTSNIMYIATGDKDQYPSSYSVGVLKSIDGGQTWNPTGLVFPMNANKTINKIIINPSNPNEIVVATSSGIRKSIDGGDSWTTALGSSDLMDVEAKPGDFNTLYTSTRDGVVHRSINSGSTWSIVFYGVSPRRIELAVSPNQPDWVYFVLVNSDNGLHGIYKSEDSGATYIQVFDGDDLNMLSYEEDGSGTDGIGWYALSMSVSPIDANSLILGSVNTWRSLDGGLSWEIVSHWYGANDLQEVHADKHIHCYRDNGDLFEGNDGGIYISTDNGTTWEDKTNGMVISQMYKLGVSQSNSAEVITGLQDNGTKLLSNNDWADVKGGDGMECIIDYVNTDVQYGTYIDGQISRTTDHWNTSVEIQPSAAGSGAWVTPYIIDPNDTNVLYAGYADVWKTVDRGDNWELISSMNSGQLLRSMAIAPSNSDVLYVADNTKIWKTMDGGISWDNITAGVPSSSNNITYIAVKDNDPNTVWVSLAGFTSQKVYQSTNGGDSWVNISSGLPSIPAYTIVYNKKSGDLNQLFVGTELGVYVKNGDSDWEPFNNGLPNVKIGELEIFYSTNLEEVKLRAATYGRGLWETPLYIADFSLAGTISTPVLCIESGHSTTLTLDGYIGQIQWQQSAEGTSNWTNVVGGVGATTISYTTSNLMANMSFRVQVTLAGLEPHYSNIISLKINPVLTFSAIPDMCNTDSAIVLNQALPVGGIYSGNYVTNGEFQPTLTSLGSFLITYTLTDTNNCTSSISQHIIIHDCVEKPKVVSEYLIYPNPAKELVTVYYNEKYTELNLYNDIGEIIYSKPLSSPENFIEIDVTRYSAGIYTIQFVSEDEINNAKILVIK